jgi:HK97 family phage portal protein
LIVSSKQKRRKGKKSKSKALVGQVQKSYSIYQPPVSAPWNWWQYAAGPIPDADYSRFGPVQTCVNIISQDLSRLPLQHIKIADDGSRTVVSTKAPSRIFRKPNSYQTKSDFLLYLMRSLLSDGNAYALDMRNDRNETSSLWPLPSRSVYPYIVPETGDVIYQISHSDAIDLAQPDINEGLWVPARNMLHVRLQTPQHPLIGVSPLLAAYYPTITGTQINQHNAHFFSNMARPSGVLQHPGELEEEAMRRIKKRFEEITSGVSTGEVAVLAEGMQWQPMTMSAVDSEVAAIYSLSERQIFQIMRVPPFLGGDLEKATFTNVESLTRFYLQSCLGFYVDHLEESFTTFFNLPPDEAIRFDLDQALLAGDFKERMDALGRGVQNGVFAPNEARARENLPPVEFGDEVRVQQQLVPLSFGAIQTAEAAQGVAAQPALPAPAPDPPDDPETDPEDEAAQERGVILAWGDRLRKRAGARAA